MVHELVCSVCIVVPRPKIYCVIIVFLQCLLQDEKKELDEITAKRQKKGRNEEEAPGEEKTILHGTVTHIITLTFH